MIVVVAPRPMCFALYRKHVGAHFLHRGFSDAAGDAHRCSLPCSAIPAREILQTVGQVARAAERVSEGVKSSAAAGEEITHSISSVDTAARETATSATQAQAASKKLSDLAEQLQDLVGHFNI